MSEADVKRIVRGYRKGSDTEWTRSETSTLPTVRLAFRLLDDVSVDAGRFHEWSIRDLDDGAELVRALERRAAAAGAGKIFVTSATRRADAHAFYEKLGYERTALRFGKPVV